MKTYARGSPPPAPPRSHAGKPASGLSTPVPRRATDRDPTARDGTDSLRFVLDQLRKAQLSLREARPADALAALDELDARAPAALLLDERDVTRALALCDLGDSARASALAVRLLERSPQSAYAASLRESCAGRELLLEQMRERASNGAR